MSRRKKLLAGFSGVITGASTGIGRALAISLAGKYSARLVLNARSQEALEDTCKQVEAAGGRCQGIVGDISSSTTQEKLINSCLEHFGGIDLLVNNAGMAHPGRVCDLTVEDWRRVFEVNFFAPLSTTYLALPHFQSQNHGKIVNISSVAGKVAFAGSVCYASSKFALTAMSEGMAAELAGANIDVITVCPGWVRTEFFEKNQVDDRKNPTRIAGENTVSGWLMRNLLSISAEETASEIEQALSKGGSHELVMTVPGKIIERLHAVCPDLVQAVNQRLPLDLVDSSEKDPSNQAG